MDIDNITDVEFLRTELKKRMVKMKENIYVHTCMGEFTFHKGGWYDLRQDEGGVYLAAGSVMYEIDYEKEPPFYTFKELNQ